MWFNRYMIAILKSPLHAVLSGNTMLVEYSGRRSGRKYQVPVNYVRRGADLLVTSLIERTWWRSLHPGAQVQLLIQGRSLPAYGEALLEPESVTGALGEFIQAAPYMARYFKVRLDERRCPYPHDLQQAAQGRVMLRFTINGAVSES